VLLLAQAEPHSASFHFQTTHLNLNSLSNYTTSKFLQLQIKQHSNNKNK